MLADTIAGSDVLFWLLIAVLVLLAIYLIRRF